MMEFFTKIVKDCSRYLFPRKRFFVDVCLGSKYIFGYTYGNLSQNAHFNFIHKKLLGIIEEFI